MGRHPLVRAFPVALVACCLAALAFLGYGRGYRAFDIVSPSMGTAAPVGTLVLTQPVAFSDVEVGDIVTFSALGSGRVTTHRVVSRTEENLTTRGDVNGATDPVPVGAANVLGRAVAVIPAGGWALRLAPGLVGGTLIVWLVTLRTRQPARRELRLVGTAIVISASLYYVRPLLGVAVLTHRALTGRAEVATVVATGALPLRIDGLGGDYVTLAPGQVGQVTVGLRDDGLYRVVPYLSMGPIWWAIIALVVASPILYVLLAPPVQLRFGPEPAPRHPARRVFRRLRYGRPPPV